MGNMHVLPTAADLRTADEKCDPMVGFVPLEPTSKYWEHHAKFCNDCNEPFDVVFVRKHHCRNCGLTFCGRCAPPRHILSQARGCMKCTKDLLMKMKDEMLAKHTKSSSTGGGAASPTAAAQQPTTAETTAPPQPAEETTPQPSSQPEEETPGMERLDVASSVDSDVEEAEQPQN